MAPLQTTVIGSFPKPQYLNIPDWFKEDLGANSDKATKAYSKLVASQTAEDKARFETDVMRATQEVVDVQSECGVSVVTDGEVRRENYIHYLCRFIDGIDFEDLTMTTLRNGAYSTALPTIRKKVSWRGPLDVAGEWQKAQELSSVPIKYTLPGPMTIIGTMSNAYYENEKDLASDLADIINVHVCALVKAGCKFIQIDEPVFARKPEQALDWGIKLLDRCFEGVGAECQKSVHICCGYPVYLDQEGYLKADPSTYFRLAPAIEASCIDAVSIEDAHCNNDLSLLSHFKNTKVIFGVVQSARSRVETQEEIEERVQEALQHIDAENLILAPDCGLAFLPMPVLKQKLMNMCAAAKACSCKRARTM